MPIYFNANYRGVGLFASRRGVAQETLNLAIKFGMATVAEAWHKRILPQHFQRGASRKYKHKKRKKAYSEIKVKFAKGESIRDPATGRQEFHNVVKGGMVDIAFEGRTEIKARSGYTIRATKNGFSLKMTVPKYILGRRRGDYPNMRKELSYITTEEAMWLGRVFLRSAIKFIKVNQIHEQIQISG